MQLNTVIFDIDGLLVDSEPLWGEAGAATLLHYNHKLSDAQYNSTTGLRTKEWIEYWFNYFNIPMQECVNGERMIINYVLDNLDTKASIMPGVHYIFNFFVERNFKIGLATSSPRALIDIVVKMAGIAPYLQATASAEELPFGKPHPQVYMACAEQLQSNVLECLCFEDSFNGLIAAKAARMKCVVVPNAHQIKDERFGAADLRLSSLQNFSQLHFNILNE